MVTKQQADKLAALAREFGADTVSVMFDLDREGENGAKQAIIDLGSRCRVRFSMDGGDVRGETSKSGKPFRILSGSHGSVRRDAKLLYNSPRCIPATATILNPQKIRVMAFVELAVLLPVRESGPRSHRLRHQARYFRRSRL
jgi:hypothetical protein